MAAAASLPPPPLPRAVGIVGVGLIGGSLGLAIKERVGILPRGFDLPKALAEAVRRGAVQPADDLEGAVREAEVVFVATPLGRLREDVEAVLAAAPEGCVVSDVGSTKRHLVEAIQDPRYLGGHPLAGGEQAGVGAARADLFDGASWYLTPGPATADWAFARLHRLLTALGAKPVAVGAGHHDRLMAATSHLTHLVANALLEQAAELEQGGVEDPLLPAAAGPSFRDATRVAGANAALWGEIFVSNAEELLGRLAAFQRRLGEMAALVQAGSVQGLAQRQAAVAALRERVLGRAQQGPLRRLALKVPNRPGALAAVALRLGEAGINIERLEVGGEGEEGEVVVWIEERFAQRAQGLLEGVEL